MLLEPQKDVEQRLDLVVVVVVVVRVCVCLHMCVCACNFFKVVKCI